MHLGSLSCTERTATQQPFMTNHAQSSATHGYVQHVSEEASAHMAIQIFMYARVQDACAARTAAAARA